MVEIKKIKLFFLSRLKTSEFHYEFSSYLMTMKVTHLFLSYNANESHSLFSLLSLPPFSYSFGDYKCHYLFHTYLRTKNFPPLFWWLQISDDYERKNINTFSHFIWWLQILNDYERRKKNDSFLPSSSVTTNAITFFSLIWGLSIFLIIWGLFPLFED